MRFVEFRARCIQVAAGIVEIGLRLAQGARAAPRGDLRVAPIAGAKRSNRLAHGLDLRYVAAQIGEFAHGLRHILEGRSIERTQRMRQCVREKSFIGFQRQLRLAQLNQRIDQCVVAFGAEMKQPLVHGATIGLGGREYLASGANGLDQALARQGGLLGRREPQILADALVGHEEPRLRGGTAGDRAQAAAQGQRQDLPRTVEAPELEPRVANAAFVALVHQEIPIHALAAIAIRFHTRSVQVGIQEKWQRERQHLGFAGAVVAPEHQMAVAKPELLGVVVVELDKAEAQRLPTRLAR